MNRHDYLTDIEKQIHEDWFNNHVMERLNMSGANTHVGWYDPGSFQYGMTLVIVGRALFITGDLGDAVYRFNDDVTFESLRNADVHYLNEKLTASERPKTIIQEQIAAKELGELFLEMSGATTLDDLEFEQRELYDALMGRSRDASFEETLYHVESADIDWGDAGSFAEEAHDCGRVPSPSSIAYAVAIREIGTRLATADAASPGGDPS